MSIIFNCVIKRFLFLKKLYYILSSPKRWRFVFLGFAPAIEQYPLLKTTNSDLLLDVGANRGQFSIIYNELFPFNTIHAFEPLIHEAHKFCKVLRNKKNIFLHLMALGSNCALSIFHVCKKTDSSSVLPIGKRQIELFPSIKELKVCNVSIMTLDSFSFLWKEASKAFLKIDVQGYELEVLKGAVEALKHCSYVYVECSEIVLYEGQALRPSVQSFLEQQGFVFHSRHNEFFDMKKQLIQADYLFIR